MADERPKTILDLAARTSASLLMTQFILKNIVGEIAVINRSPTQAEAFVARLRSETEKFAINANPAGNEMDALYLKEMLDCSNAILGGISFVKGS